MAPPFHPRKRWKNSFIFSLLHSLFPRPQSLFSLLHSLFLRPHFIFSLPHFLFSLLRSLFSRPHSLFLLLHSIFSLLHFLFRRPHSFFSRLRPTFAPLQPAITGQRSNSILEHRVRNHPACQHERARHQHHPAGRLIGPAPSRNRWMSGVHHRTRLPLERYR